MSDNYINSQLRVNPEQQGSFNIDLQSLIMRSILTRYKGALAVRPNYDLVQLDELKGQDSTNKPFRSRFGGDEFDDYLADDEDGSKKWMKRGVFGAIAVLGAVVAAYLLAPDSNNDNAVSVETAEAETDVPVTGMDEINDIANVSSERQDEATALSLMERANEAGQQIDQMYADGERIPVTLQFNQGANGATVTMRTDYTGFNNGLDKAITVIEQDDCRQGRLCEAFNAIAIDNIGNYARFTPEYLAPSNSSITFSDYAADAIKICFDTRGADCAITPAPAPAR